MNESKQIYFENIDLLNQIVEKYLHMTWFQISADADAAQDCW